ncbi:mismatch repair endonuclease PMS2 [Caerostris darwini]|uniref:Mismatch repair endonuclease PMS2 n=1 Tax=Caerostris darwini TaxID=1538125 RepID=A0AAV4P325_9ARAC|nr:mismatch repair endonuclease PMS2 [Caerostris darwini]
MATGNIKPIDRSSVHKICSGQVVLTLSVAVKELVENSIDAGATTIEIKLEDYGSKSIEVSDNGKGVKACDFQSLTLKHHTSKIEDFSDVPFVSTFGFRGEALSSLCALSDLEITTRHSESEVGSTLSFDHNGALIKNIPSHRQVGTTVTIKNIFHTFPVRHKEFLRNLRKEYFKMVQLLTAYCLISVNKRITCSNISVKGKKTIVLSTNNSQCLKDNVISVFGDKQMKSLMEILQHSPSKAVLDEYFLPDSAAETSKTFKLEGFISKSTHGEGRSSSDRQFYFINGRPCDLPKVSKLINEVYHLFNKNQYPFVFLNVILNEGCADVNVTPDKRQIFIPDEKILLALIKATLIGMYGKQPAEMNIPILNFMTVEKKESSPIIGSISIKPQISNNFDSSLKRKLLPNSSLSDDDENPFPPLKNQKLDYSLNRKNDPDFTESPAENNTPSNSLSGAIKTSLSEEFAFKKTSANKHLPNDSNKNIGNFQTSTNKVTENVNFTMTIPINEEKVFKASSPRKHGSHKLSEILNNARLGSKSSRKVDNQNLRIPMKQSDKFKNDDNSYNFLEKFSCSKKHASELSVLQIPSSHDDKVIELCDVEGENNEINSSEEILESSFDEPLQRKRNYKVIPFSMEMIKKKTLKEDNQENNEEKCDFRKFRSKIDPSENQNAEEELKKEIRKENFADMTIIGQFNLGFIIARFGDDLFIIDQHATDEKYNYEQLQKETILKTQQLLQPQALNLTSVSESVLIENLHIFEMNGFKFKINEENPSSQKVQLVSVPVSHNWSFGKEDVDELIFMLTDNPIRMVRPSRVNQMFASRACRKSVMIGTALTVPMMKKLVTHMGEIEQPWNCPHGRPTIRHLFNLNILKTI